MSSGFLLKWKIRNFSFCHHCKGDCLFSPIFLKHKFCKDWSLRLFPRGEYGTEGSISLDWDCVGTDNRATYKIEIIGPRGKILAKFHETRISMWNNKVRYDVGRDIVMQNIQEVNQDILTIHCNIYEVNSKKLEPELCEACTTIPINRQFFEWSVPDTWQDFSTSEYIPFPSSDFRVKLKIILRSLRLFIYKTKNENRSSHFIQIQLRSLSENGYEKLSMKAAHLFSLEGTNNSDDLWKCPTALDNDDCIVENGFLKIQCEFACSGEDIPDNTNSPAHHALRHILKSDNIANALQEEKLNNISSPAQQPWRQLTVSDNITDGFPTLQEDAYNMLCDKKHCDIKLRVSDSMVEAHKSILASRSPVFSTMFDQDMTETHTGIVTIPDVAVTTFNSFLKFLYTDKVDDMTCESASNLIMVAEKYQVLALKQKCAEFLKYQLKMENACEMVKLADMVCHNELKVFAVDFIALNSKAILKMPEWNSWMRSNMDLATEILSKITESIIIS